MAARSGSTAYAANRYAPRPAAPGTPVGKLMSAKQRDFVVTLANDTYRARAAAMLITPIPGGMTAAQRDTAVAETITPAAIITAVQDTLNRTDITARALIENMILNRDRARADLSSLRAKYGTTASLDASAAAPLSMGTYRTPAGAVYRVVPSQGSGRLYASLYVPESASWDYAPGAMRLLTPAMRLTHEQEREFGQATGMCCRCGRLLTDPTSVDYGMGPVCRSKD